MIGTYLTVPEAQRKVSPEQRVQVNKRAAQVSQGSIIEERIQMTGRSYTMTITRRGKILMPSISKHWSFIAA